MLTNQTEAHEVNSMFKGLAMTDFFDDGFAVTRNWLEHGCKGTRPYPLTNLNDVDRIDWWRGSDKAFSFCAELDKQENVKVAMIEDFILKCIYGAVGVFGVYLIAQFSMLSMLCGAIILAYSLKKVFRK